MSRWLLVVVAALVAAVVLTPTPGVAQGCKDQKWCFEAEEFAFRVKDDEVTVDMLRQIHKGEDTGMLIDYLLKNRSRLFIGWLRPTPEMHSVTFPWNVGLQLKSDETIWAEKWFVGKQQGSSSVYDSTDVKIFVPGVNEARGKSFVIVLSFPKEKKNGDEWRNGQVEGLAVRQRD